MALSAVFEGPGAVAVVDRPGPELGEADARLRVEACGVCGSDVTSYRSGAYVSTGQVMGHEFVGRVLEAGPRADVTVGDRLVVRPMRSCGRCWYCRRGDIHLCSGTARLSLSFGLPGGYAQEVHLPSPQVGVDVFRIPESVDARDAIWVEPLAVALHALALAGPVTGGTVAVAGAGSVGLCLLTAARLAGATTWVVEPRDTRRTLAQQLGAVRTFADATDVPAGAVDVILDSTGIPDALSALLAAAAPATSVVLVGVTARELHVPPALTLRGSFGYAEQDFVRAADLVASGRARLGAAVTHEFDLLSFHEAMTTASSHPDAGKVVIRP